MIDTLDQARSQKRRSISRPKTDIEKYEYTRAWISTPSPITVKRSLPTLEISLTPCNSKHSTSSTLDQTHCLPPYTISPFFRCLPWLRGTTGFLEERGLQKFQQSIRWRSHNLTTSFVKPQQKIRTTLAASSVACDAQDDPHNIRGLAKAERNAFAKIITSPLLYPSRSQTNPDLERKSSIALMSPNFPCSP